MIGSLQSLKQADMCNSVVIICIYLLSSAIQDAVVTPDEAVGCTSGNNKLEGPESKPIKTAGTNSVGEKYTVILKYCIEPMNIRDN